MKFNIIRRYSLIGLTITALSLPGFASAKTHKKETAATTQSSGEGSSLSQSDRTFMKKAAKGGEMEVAMGQVAAQNATNSDVKAFGQRMVTDHSKANDQLRSIAAKKGVTLPNNKPAETWSSDKAYVNMMVKDHEKDLAEFQKEASETNDPDLKQFAGDTAKVIQQHLDLIKNIQGKVQ